MKLLSDNRGTAAVSFALVGPAAMLLSLMGIVVGIEETLRLAVDRSFATAVQSTGYREANLKDATCTSLATFKLSCDRLTVKTIEAHGSLDVVAAVYDTTLPILGHTALSARAVVRR